MNILKIYEKYKIMPQLQLHQLRVASVGKFIIQNFQENIRDEKDVITALLLHDMGNIIKFDLTLYPECLKPLGLDYWENVRNEFIEKYGLSEHKATYKIATEIGIAPRVMEILQCIGFSQSTQNTKHLDYSKKIATYSDYRVAPYGIVSLDERENEGRIRYTLRGNVINQEKDDRFKKLFRDSQLVEKQIFEKCKITPDEINDESCGGYIKQLEKFEV